MVKLKGGSGRAIPPILKRLGLLSSDGTPTELYAKFRTDSGRGKAAYQALRNGFPEIFKRSDYAHTVPDTKLRDIIVEITGLKPNDNIVVAIKGTFNVVKAFVPTGFDPSSDDAEGTTNSDDGQNNSYPSITNSSSSTGNSGGGIRLAYNINIVLPETSDLKVLNAIFRSIKENLMQ